MELDPQVKALATAIKKQESGGSKDPYNAKGASGEHGAYQFMPDTWKSWAGTHLGDANAPMTIENQNKVAYNQIKSWKNKGYNPAQIAAAWNAGEGSLKGDKWKTNVGTNNLGVKYDTPTYVKNVSQYYKEKSQSQPNSSPINYGEMTPAGSDTKQPLPIEIAKQAITSAVELPTSIGGGVMNAIRAGGRTVGMDTPAVTSNKSLLGSGVAPIGYNQQGEELGGWDTTKQAIGAGLETASYVAVPELKGLTALGKASPVWKQILSGAVKTGIQGAEYSGGSSLRTNPEDTVGAIQNAGIGFGTGVVLGGGLSAAGALTNKLTGTAKNIETRINNANGDMSVIERELSTPEGKTYLKSKGLGSIEDVSKNLDSAYDTFQSGVEDYYAKNNNLARKITKQTSRDDLHTVMEYAADTPFKVEGRKLNTLKTSEAIIADQKKVGESMSSIIDGMDMGGIDTSIPRRELELMILSELDNIASTSGGATINKELAMKQIRNMIGNQVGKKTSVPMKAQHTLKVSANERYPLDPEKSTKEAAGEALGNAIRKYQDNLIAKGAETGSIDATAIQAYKDLNTAWGKLERAKIATDIIAKTTKPPTRPRFLPEIVGGLASGGYNPLVYWGTQASTRGVLNGLDNAILRARYNVDGINLNPSAVKKLILNAEKAKAGIASHIENNTARQMEAEASRKYAEDMIAKRGLPVTPEYDTYELGKDIQMGPKPVSKYKQPSNLPVAPDTPPKVYSHKSGPEYEPYIPDHKLPTIRGMVTPGQLNAMTALTGALGIGGVAQNKFGVDKYTREDSTPQLTPQEEKAIKIVPENMIDAVKKAVEHTGMKIDKVINHMKAENGNDWRPELVGKADPTDKGVTQLNTRAIDIISGKTGPMVDFFKQNFGHTFDINNVNDQILGYATYMNWLRQYALPEAGIKNPTTNDVMLAYNLGAKGLSEVKNKTADATTTARYARYYSLLKANNALD
jgi:hypothetical protein